MMRLDEEYKVLGEWSYVSLKHEGDKVVAFERGGLLFVFNFNATKSFTDYKIGVDMPGAYRVVLNSDNKENYLGHGRIDESSKYHTFPEEWCGRKNHLFVYIPARSAIVLGLDE
eukprot:NODE_198_length_15297_cov_0.486182.p15 type:complete len:114 gc:universal NODE_198_length_15297_cov_0.486182:7573-7232(-)